MGVLAAVLLAGCAIDRPALTPPELESKRTEYVRYAVTETEEGNQKVIRRMKRERDEFAAGESKRPPVYDILVLSGGGDYGAFGAGFLKGWGTMPDGTMARPEFDMVTGVSTGALIAPFAFIGDDLSYDKILDLYTHPKKDWVTLRDVFFFLPGRTSFMSTAGLEKELKEQFNDDVIRQVAACSKQDRVLGINATNLDLGAMHPFEVSREAQHAVETGDYERVRKIIMASAAIPAAFPPVEIDGSLYVDGGTTSNILYGSNWRSPRAPIAMYKAAYPGSTLPKIRFWVIVNNQLGIGPQIVQPTWVSITKASLATAIRSSTVIAMRHLYTQVQLLRDADGVDVEFRYVSIPESWRAPAQGDFNPKTMQSLADVGMQMGADPASWRSDFSK